MTITLENKEDIVLFKKILKEARYSYLRERDMFFARKSVTPEMQAWADEHIHKPLNRVEQLLSLIQL